MLQLFFQKPNFYRISVLYGDNKMIEHLFFKDTASNKLLDVVNYWKIGQAKNRIKKDW